LNVNNIRAFFKDKLQVFSIFCSEKPAVMIRNLKAKYLANIDRLTQDKADMNTMTNDIIAQLEFCMDIMENLSGFYEKADTEGKQRIINSIFTGNLIYSEEKV
jgi:hypothetical protein